MPSDAPGTSPPRPAPGRAACGHALDDLGRARVGRGVVAERAIEERLRLRRQPVPVDRRAEHDAVRRQEVFEEEAAEAVVEGALAAGAATVAAVAEEVRDVVGEEADVDLRPGRAGAPTAARRRASRAGAAWTADEDEEPVDYAEDVAVRRAAASIAPASSSARAGRRTCRAGYSAPWGCKPAHDADALVVVDAISDFRHEDGDDLARAFAAVAPRLAEALAAARTGGTPVIIVNDARGHWDGDRTALVERALAGRAPEAVAAVAPREGDRVLYKPRYSAFDSTPLALVLQELEVERVVLAGTATEMCVAQTAIQAREHGLAVSVLRDACADTNPDDAEIALQYPRTRDRNVRRRHARLGVTADPGPASPTRPSFRAAHRRASTRASRAAAGRPRRPPAARVKRRVGARAHTPREARPCGSSAAPVSAARATPARTTPRAPPARRARTARRGPARARRRRRRTARRLARPSRRRARRSCRPESRRRCGPRR